MTQAAPTVPQFLPTDVDELPPTPADSASPEPDLPVVRPDTVVAATFDALMRKPKRSAPLFVNSRDGNGDPIKLKLQLEAIDGPAFDALRDKFGPNREQQAKGLEVNPDKFGPALAEAVITEPKLTAAQWDQIRQSPEWSGGEWSSVFNSCWAICQSGVGVPFTDDD